MDAINLFLKYAALTYISIKICLQILEQKFSVTVIMRNSELTLAHLVTHKHKIIVGGYQFLPMEGLDDYLQ